MKKSAKMIVVGILLIFIVSMTGCGSKIPELSDEDESAVVQYMADSLIEHNTGYQATILSEEEIAAEKERRRLTQEEIQRQKDEEARKASEEAEQQQADDIDVIGNVASGETNAQRDFSEMDSYLDLVNMEITYEGWELTDSYPKGSDDMFLAVAAKEGHQLMVVKLKVLNASNESKSIDIGAMNNKYRFSVNGEKYTSMLLTLLEDDFSTFAGSLESGETKELVMITEVADIASVDSLSLQVIIPDKTRATFSIL